MNTADTLRLELRDDPAKLYGTHVLDGNAHKLLGILMTADRPFKCRIKRPQLIHFGRKAARLQRCKYAADMLDGTGVGLPDYTGISPEQNAAANIALGVFTGAVNWFDPNFPDDVELIDQLEAGGILTTPEKTAFLALADVTGTRAAELGCVETDERLYLGHVNQALSLINRGVCTISAENPAKVVCDRPHEAYDGLHVRFHNTGIGALDDHAGLPVTVVAGDNADVEFTVPYDNSGGSGLTGIAYYILD